jgi:hypothetical protein
VPLETAALTLHQAIVDSLNENPQIIGAGTVQLNLFESGQVNQAQLAQIQRIQRTFVFVQQWGWTLWFIPLLSLALIFTLVVRSVSQWGFWWGWPLLLAGLSALLLAAMVPAVLLVYSRTAVTVTADGGLTLAAISRRLADTLTDLWLRRVLIQSAIMTAVGFGFVLLGFVTRPAVVARKVIAVAAASFPNSQLRRRLLNPQHTCPPLCDHSSRYFVTPSPSPYLFPSRHLNR